MWGINSYQLQVSGALRFPEATDVLETRNLEPGTWNPELGTRNLEPGTWNLKPGT